MTSTHIYSTGKKTNMAIGTQYIAPVGWITLKPDTRYWRVGDSTDKAFTVFAVFGAETPSVEIIRLPRVDLERGLLEKTVIAAETQMNLPPWLNELEGQDLSRTDTTPRRLAHGIRTHRSVVDNRLTWIAEALQHMPAILNAADPVRVVNKFAAQAVPQQNTVRFRTWLFAYVCCGENEWSLIPNMHRNGTWDRCTEERLKVRRGAPTKHFAHRPHYPRDAVMQAKIREGYLRFARLGKTMPRIYSEAMVAVFKCVPIKDALGYDYWHQPDGEPFPTLAQFQRGCEIAFKRPALQVTLFGEVRFRNKLKAIVGRVSEGVANLMEKCSIDASYSKLFPRGILDDFVALRICIVKLVDSASGAIVGIGFALGGETAKAYMMALFCCAIGKARWGRYFGVELTDDDIPGEGLPANFSSDRGAFVAAEVSAELSELKHGRDMSPTHNPQSNATVESKNSREMHARGIPTHVFTEMNSIQLIRYTINECAELNRSGSALSRITREMANEVNNAVPIEVWKYMNVRGRNDSKAISFSDAVRRFLTPVKFTSRDGMLFLKEMRYTSPDLDSSSLPTLIRNQDGVEICGYVIDVVVRFAWIEHEGHLIEVEAQDPLREDDEILYQTIEDLDDYAEKMRKLRAVQRDGRAVAFAVTAHKNQKEIGPAAKSIHRRSGRPNPKNTLAKAEAKALEFKE